MLVKVIQAELKNYNRRADNSVSLRLDSLQEVASGDIAEVDSHRGDIAIVVLTDSLVGNDVDIDIDDILKNLPENDTLEYKSPSKRFRNVLWKLLEEKLGRKPTKDEFADYYKMQYEYIIEKYKNKFKNNN